MDDVDLDFKSKRVLFELINENIFCTKQKYKLDSEIKISDFFPIYLKNPNEFELEYFKTKSYNKLYSFVSLFPTLQYLLNLKSYDLDIQYFAFSRQINELQYLYEDYLYFNDDILKSVADNNKIAFCSSLSNFLNDCSILVEIKDWNLIDKYLIQYFNCDSESVFFRDYREQFIEKYLNFFNIINFDLRVYQGIRLVDSSERFFDFPFMRNDEYNKVLDSLFKNIYLTDSFVSSESDVMNLLFLINLFDEGLFFKERKYIVDFVTALEFLFVKKFDRPNIEMQFKYKIRRCCKELGYHISIDELKDLYNYRSLIVHGNFVEINNKIADITRRVWYKNFVENNGFDDEITQYDNNEKETLIYSRLYELFVLMFKLYCEDRKNVDLMKVMDCKEKIESFVFL